MLVTWVHPNAHVLQYRVSYTPLNGDARENSVSAFRRVKHLILYCLCLVELFCLNTYHRFHTEGPDVIEIYRKAL